MLEEPERLAETEPGRPGTNGIEREPEMKTRKFLKQVVDDEFSNEEIRLAINEVFTKYFDKFAGEEMEDGDYIRLSPKTGRIMSTLWYNIEKFKFSFKTENGDRFKTTTKLQLTFIHGRKDTPCLMRMDDKSALACLAIILNAIDEERHE